MSNLEGVQEEVPAKFITSKLKLLLWPEVQTLILLSMYHFW